MRKTVTLLVILGLLAGAMAAPAEAKKKKKKKKPRVVEVEYTGGGIGVIAAGLGGGICPMTEPGSGECIEIPLMPGEKYVKVEVKDATGLGPAGFITQGDVDGDGVADGYGDFCGAHEEPVALNSPSIPVRVSFYPGVCASGMPSVPTTGTIVATFSATP